MLVRPDTHLRIGNDEPMQLQSGVEGAAMVELVPRFAHRVEHKLTKDGSFIFPHMPAPEVVEVRWKDRKRRLLFTSYVEVVQRHYFPLDALRGYGDGADDFSNRSDDEIYVVRQAATEIFEENAHRSFVLRLGRTKDYGRCDLVWLDHNDVSDVFTPGYDQVSDCQLERNNDNAHPFPRWIDYVYGLDHPQQVVSDAVLTLAAYMLRPSNRPLGATGESSDAGYIHFTIAGRDGATAIPEVNAVIEQFGRGVRYVM